MSALLIDTSCYIHEIPLSVYRVVCGQLDQNDRWQRLAQKIGYENTAEFEEIKQSKSPGTKLLDSWATRHHTVTELFMALYCMQEYHIMENLRDLVDKAYHRLIKGTSKTQTSTKSKSTSFSIETLSKHKKSTASAAAVTSNSSFGLKSDSSRIKSDSIFSGIPQISFAELTVATNQWNHEKILGSGGFGTVYRGKWKCTSVAIKRISCHGSDKDETSRKQLRQIMIEMRFLNAHRHDNILPLYGYSYDGSSTCLVYQMMSNGSLDRRLQSPQRLTYKQRLNIAIGAARGIAFLHTFHKRPTIHGDIKSANILLDENLQPKLGDFGLARQTNGSTKAKYVYGTHAYIAPDFRDNYVICTKNDVYSFGVVLFELATGKRSWEQSRGSYGLLTKLMWAFSEKPNQYSDLVDSKEKHQSSKAIPVLTQLIKIGFRCTRSLAVNRPEMPDVLNSLMEI